MKLHVLIKRGMTLLNNFFQALLEKISISKPSGNEVKYVFEK